jgi:MHS family proline/betaine transporter-like MFS transporter
MMHQFSILFFPELSPTLATYAVFSTFAISYFARILGGYLFGYIGDYKGRRHSLMASLIGMGICSLFMGILPAYQTIGLLAPILLLLLRFFQGIFVSGEFTNAAVFLFEHAKQKPNFASSWISTGSALGMLIGGSLAYVVTLNSMPIWAWRVPFIFGFVMAIIGVFMRYNISEPADFLRLIREGKTERRPLTRLFKNYFWPSCQVAALATFVGIYIYICNLWWLTFNLSQSYFSAGTTKLLAIGAQTLVVILTPLVAWQSEKHNNKKIMQYGLILSMIVPLLLFYFTFEKNLSGIIVAEGLYALANALVTANMFKYLSTLFPTSVRCSGISNSWNFAVATVGGTAPMAAQFLINHQSPFAPAYYVSISAVIALFFMMKTTRKHKLNQEYDYG